MGIMDLLRKLADGEYDGERIDNENNGVEWGFYIDKGTPVKYRYGKTVKFFDGKENTKSRKVEEEHFDTEEKKTFFLQRYGFLSEMFGNHPEVMNYSRQYHESQKKKN